MKRTHRLTQRLLPIVGAALLASTGVMAADNGAAPRAPTAAERPLAPTDPRVDPTRRDAATRGESDQLEQRLRAGQNRADYARILESNGYRIAAINQDKPDYLEYEVVKGDRSYEIQLKFDKGAARASDVDVATNMWRADATKRMLADANYKHPRAPVADPEGRYSDSRYRQAWTDEKDRLEKALPPNLKVGEYKPKLEAMGYQVTSVNERDRNHVEYEVAKGDNSYEVKIDVDPNSQVAKDVDVTSNLWEAAPTDRATDRAKDRAASPRRN